MRARLFAAVKRLARALMATRLRYLPGARAVYERLYMRLAPQRSLVVEFEGSKVCVDPRDVGVSLYLITEGRYEPQLTALLKDLIEPGMVVVDGGANVGCFTMLAARLVGEEGHVYAFEPAHRNLDLLRRGVELNGYENVTVVPCALSNGPGAVTLYLDRANHGAPSLRRGNVADSVAEQKAATISLDDYFLGRERPADLIKLDVQGAEGLALEGAGPLLDRDGLTIVAEFWPAGLRNMGTDPGQLLRDLRDRGFELAWLDERSGALGPRADADAIGECDRREHEQGFATLVLRR